MCILVSTSILIIPSFHDKQAQTLLREWFFNYRYLKINKFVFFNSLGRKFPLLSMNRNLHWKDNLGKVRGYSCCEQNYDLNCTYRSPTIYLSNYPEANVLPWLVMWLCEFCVLNNIIHIINIDWGDVQNYNEYGNYSAKQIIISGGKN